MSAAVNTFSLWIFCLKWVSIFSTGQRAFIAPVFHRSDTVPGMWFRQWKTCLMKGHTFSRPGRCFSNMFPRLHCSIPPCWLVCQIPGLDICKEIIHMVPSLFLTLFKKCNKTFMVLPAWLNVVSGFQNIEVRCANDLLRSYFNKASQSPSCQHICKRDSDVFPSRPLPPQCHARSSRTRSYSWWGYKLPTM